jgi:hypothetical protein
MRAVHLHMCNRCQFLDIKAQHLDTAMQARIHPSSVGPAKVVGHSLPLPLSKTSFTHGAKLKWAKFPMKMERLCTSRGRHSGLVAHAIRGLYFSENEGNGTGPNIVPDFVPPALRHRYTIGRSELVNLSMSKIGWERLQVFQPWSLLRSPVACFPPVPVT